MKKIILKCKNCGYVWEVWVDGDLSKLDLTQFHCPKCNSNNIIRKYSIGGFEFKGAGFYETDYKKKGGK